MFSLKASKAKDIQVLINHLYLKPTNFLSYNQTKETHTSIYNPWTLLENIEFIRGVLETERIAMLSLQVKILYYAGTMNILDTMTFFVK